MTAGAEKLEAEMMAALARAERVSSVVYVQGVLREAREYGPLPEVVQLRALAVYANIRAWAVLGEALDGLEPAVAERHAAEVARLRALVAEKQPTGSGSGVRKGAPLPGAGPGAGDGNEQPSPVPPALSGADEQGVHGVTCDEVAPWLNALWPAGVPNEGAMRDHVRDCPGCGEVAKLRALEVCE